MLTYEDEYFTAIPLGDNNFSFRFSNKIKYNGDIESFAKSFKKLFRYCYNVNAPDEDAKKCANEFKKCSNYSNMVGIFAKYMTKRHKYPAI